MILYTRTLYLYLVLPLRFGWVDRLHLALLSCAAGADEAGGTDGAATGATAAATVAAGPGFASAAAGAGFASAAGKRLGSLYVASIILHVISSFGCGYWEMAGLRFSQWQV